MVSDPGGAIDDRPLDQIQRDLSGLQGRQGRDAAEHRRIGVG
jgi:hypothetical protein